MPDTSNDATVMIHFVLTGMAPHSTLPQTAHHHLDVQTLAQILQGSPCLLSVLFFH